MATFIRHLIFCLQLAHLVKSGLQGYGGTKDEYSRCHGKHFSCGVTMRTADIGKTVLVESPKYPSKVSCGVNCVIKIKTEPGNNIILRWKGFVLDGCHEGNKMRIVDGSEQQIHCGDKIPKTYVSEGHEIEIAFAVVNMYRDDRGLIYKFTYEATRARKSKRLSGLPRSLQRQPNLQNSQRPQMPQFSTQKPQQSQQMPQGQQQGQQQGHQQQHQNQIQGQNQQIQQRQEYPRSSIPKSKPQNDYIYNYDLRYRNRDYEHSSRSNNRFDGRSEKYEIIEIIEEVDDEKDERSDLEIAKPYIFMTLALTAILVPVAYLIRMLFCKRSRFTDDIKQFT